MSPRFPLVKDDGRSCLRSGQLNKVGDVETLAGKPLKRHFPKHVRTVRADKLYLTPGADSCDRAIGSSDACKVYLFSILYSPCLLITLQIYLGGIS
jgi:hypothetical protein